MSNTLFKKFSYNPETNTSVICIHSNTYNCSYSHVQRIVMELRKDFTLKDEEIDVVTYNGDRFRGMTGVEAMIQGKNVPKDYEKIEKGLLRF